MIALLSFSCLAAVVALLVAHSGWHGWHIDHELKPIDVLTLLVNICIAILLQYFFVSRSGNKRVEKDLIIEDIRDVIVRIRESNEQFLRRVEKSKSTQEEWKTAIYQARIISNGVEQCLLLLESASCGKCRKRAAECEKLKQDLFAYKAALTSTSAGKKISVDTIKEQAAAYRQLMRDLQSLVIEINTH